VPFTAFRLFVASEVAREEECALFAIFLLNCVFLPILPQLKLLFKNLIALIMLVFDATFVLNLTFLGLLSREISFGKYTHSHTQTRRHEDCLSQLIS